MARPFRDCRAIGHHWEEIPTPTDPTRAFRAGEVWTFRCERCATVRWWRRNCMTGGMESCRYDYPDGYHYAEKITRAQLWREKAAERRASSKPSRASSKPSRRRRIA